MTTTVRPSQACEVIAATLRAAGLRGVREHCSKETGHIVVVGCRGDGVYHAVPTGGDDIRVRWFRTGGEIIALGTVDRPARVAGLILDHESGL